MTPSKIAIDYIGRGWAPIPVPYLTKAPTHKRWQELRITDAKAFRYFNGGSLNIGVLTGEPSDDLVDGDLDCVEAVAVAPDIMPATGSVFGHGGRVGHLLYHTAGLRYLELADPETGETILELRGTGHQTIFPGSVHPCGEPIEWIEDGAMAAVSVERLIAAARETGAAVLLVRAAPGPGGGRHEYMLDVAGSLVRSLGADGARHVLAPVGRLVFGKLYSKRDEKRLIDGTAAKLASDGRVSDIGALITRLGGKRAGRVIEWLGLRDTRQEHGAAQAANLLRGTRAAPEEPSRSAEGRPKIGIAYDADLAQRPGGILQELTEWMTGTHKRPQPELALGGSLALLGLLCAHKYRLLDNGQDTRTNIVAIALAASVAGKDHPRRCVKAVLAALGMSDFVSEDIASGQAIEGAFVDRSANLFLIDEYGHRIAAALDPKGSASEKKLVEVVTKLSTSAAGLYAHTRRAEHRHAPVPCTWDPLLAMFATTVEGPLWENMRSRHVVDGSLARHLFFKAATDYPDLVHDVPHFEDRLPEMVAHARRVLIGGGSEFELSRRLGALRAQYEDDGRGNQVRLQPTRPELVAVPIDDAAGAELRRLEEEELALLRGHLPLGTNALVGRLVEHTKRLALICAVSDSPEVPILRHRHVLWAEAVAKQSLTTVLRATAEHVADTAIEASRNKLLRHVRRVSAGGWVTRRDVTRGSQWLDTRSRAALLAELVDWGLVEAQTANRGGQSTDEFRCA